MAKIIFKEEAFAIGGTRFEVNNDKGCGFLEPI